MDNFELPEPLIPHSYPRWITASIVFCLISFFICLVDLPRYFYFNKKFKNAHASLKRGDYSDASIKLMELNTLLPSHKQIKILASKALFKSSQETDHIIALKLLDDISLSKGDWDKLLNYMPEQYVSLFKEVELKS